MEDSNMRTSKLLVKLVVFSAAFAFTGVLGGCKKNNPCTPGMTQEQCDAVQGKGGAPAASADSAVAAEATPAPEPTVEAPATYAIPVAVTGLDGGILVLENHGADFLTVTQNGTFEFPTVVEDEDEYLVEVLANPDNPSQTCTVTNGHGHVAGASPTGISVNCERNCTISHEVEQASYNQTTAYFAPSDLFQKGCQSITFAQETTLENFSILMRKSTAGSTTGTVIVYTDVPGSYDCEAGSVVASTSTATYAASEQWVKFSFAETPVLAAGVYKVVFTPEAKTYVYASNLNPYAGGCEYLKMWINPNYVWNRTAGPCAWDMAFRVNSRNSCE
ncbi:MAG: hypothetical protein A2583_15365 [Bdellovibrionales bacterium RIFOXYD1_FULL_53_11]|nr:MAG: hypothetical protein A2583_15365 [Bdellovibrionales bacterium RIFOXYD1_FULL_53_11]